MVTIVTAEVDVTGMYHSDMNTGFSGTVVNEILVPMREDSVRPDQVQHQDPNGIVLYRVNGDRCCNVSRDCNSPIANIMDNYPGLIQVEARLLRIDSPFRVGRTYRLPSLVNFYGPVERFEELQSVIINIFTNEGMRQHIHRPRLQN